MDDNLRPITDSIGLIREGPSTLSAVYMDWMSPLLNQGSRLEARRLAGSDVRESVMSLCPLAKVGMTRVLFMPVSHDWTAILSNGWRGTDMSSIVPVLSAKIGCQALRVTCVPDIHDNDLHRFGARIFESHDGQQTPSRILSVARDGRRWSALFSGAPLPQEDPAWFEGRRVQDRFTSEHLFTLVERVVPGVWDIDRWPRQGRIMVERQGILPPAFGDVSLEDAQRGIPKAT